MALLTYGVVERKGFILLTGEVGTGKTTMVHALLGNLDESVRCIFLSNPLLSQQDFIDYLAFSAFKQKAHFKSTPGSSARVSTTCDSMTRTANPPEKRGFRPAKGRPGGPASAASGAGPWRPWR